MRILRLITAAALCGIFFIWSFYGDYSGLINPYFPWFFIFIIPAMLIISIPQASDILQSVFRLSGKYSFVIFPLFTLSASLFVSVFVFHGIPHVQDEINYKFLAQSLLKGSMTSPVHPHYEFFDFLYIIPGVSGTYSIYQPGFSALLALFIFLKIPFLLNPLLTAGSVFLLGKTAEELYDAKTAALSMFLCSTSLFVFSMGGTWMTHSFCAFNTLGAVYFSLITFRNFSLKNTIISFFFLSMLILTRPQNALFIFIPVAIWSLSRLSFRNLCRYFAVSIVLLGAATLFLYYTNYIVTGDMFTPKHKAFFSYTEPDEGCMSIGPGSGCRHSTIIELPEEGMTVKHGTYITYLRLYQLVYGLFFHPVIFFFIPFLFLFYKNRKHWNDDISILSLFLITFAGYFYYYYDGNVYGPRYYYEVSFFLILLAARGIILFHGLFRNDSANPLFRPVNILFAFFLAGLTYQFAIFAPPLYKMHMGSFWGTDQLLEERLKEKNIVEGVVFIAPDSFYSSGAALMDLTGIDSNRLIFARDLGPSENGRLMDYFPGKKFYRVFYNRPWYEKNDPEITQLERKNIPEILHIELESKKYPVEGIPDYCNKFPAWPYIDKYSGFTLDISLTAGKQYYFCRFKNNDEFYTFGQYIPAEGKYLVSVNALKTPFSGKFTISSGNNSGTLDLFSSSDIYDTVKFEMYLKKGFNLIKIKPDQTGGPEYRYFIIDSIDIMKVP